MKQSVTTWVVLLTFLFSAIAQRQVGLVTANGPFELRGANVTPGTVPSWPVLDGDEIVTKGTPVTITFPDGSIVTVAPHSTVKIEMDGNTPVVRVLAGKISYQLKQAGAVKFFAADKAVTITNTTGSIGMKAGGGFWTATTIGIFAGAGAAAGIGAGIAATRGGSSVSGQ